MISQYISTAKLDLTIGQINSVLFPLNISANMFVLLNVKKMFNEKEGLGKVYKSPIDSSQLLLLDMIAQKYSQLKTNSGKGNWKFPY